MSKTVMTRIRPEDFQWLRARAEMNHRTMSEEISAIRDILIVLSIDLLPRPKDANPVPVVKFQE